AVSRAAGLRCRGVPAPRSARSTVSPRPARISARGDQRVRGRAAADENRGHRGAARYGDPRPGRSVPGTARGELVPDSERDAAVRERHLVPAAHCLERADRKSTRLNSSHVSISYAVFCLKKKKHKYQLPSDTPNKDD